MLIDFILVNLFTDKLIISRSFLFTVLIHWDANMNSSCSIQKYNVDFNNYFKNNNFNYNYYKFSNN